MNFIKHRNEGQAQKLLDQEKAEEYFQRLVEFGDPDLEPVDEDDLNQNSIEEADELFDTISGQYTMIDHSADLD